jgi:hypothetical protein
MEWLPASLESWLQCLSSLFVVVGGGVAVCTYRREERLREAQWIHDLQKQHDENERFRRVRALIDMDHPRRERFDGMWLMAGPVTTTWRSWIT